MAVHSNLGGGKCGYIGLVEIPNFYSLLTSIPFSCQVHTGNLVIPIVATRHTQEELKRQYEKNL